MSLKPQWFLNLGWIGILLLQLKCTPKNMESLTDYIHRLYIPHT